jgi:hypothetical protein
MLLVFLVNDTVPVSALSCKHAAIGVGNGVITQCTVMSACCSMLFGELQCCIVCRLVQAEAFAVQGAHI